MQDYEKLGAFYLGRHFDLALGSGAPDLVLFESRHLVTHGLVVGMTGSGKTGLCVDLIEEAAIDGIPSIVIDPKGDLSNLLLTFPELRGEDFAPWINEEEAAKAGLSGATFGAQEAERWRKGLAQWDQDGERIRRLKSTAEFAIYTPGSTAGRRVSILDSFAPPPAAVLEDGELLRDRVSSTVASLLAMAGVEADPVRSRESILVANVLQNAWTKGRHLDLAGLIGEVQNPALQRIGVLDLEGFFPAKERFELALRLNNVLASPGFSAWMEGDPLDVSRLLYTPAGKPRVAILSIAHLGDAERMFFVTLVLNEMLSWMRAQSGTGSLRALLYMDEIFGYFPPVANPPSKQPLLTLLKQARAYGLGVVLATQNPVDLDYKGLANIGTWFIGRLQTDRDKARVLEGLEGAAAGRGARFDRAAAEEILAGLGSRVFLLHSVHEESSVIFESRWAMSYLRGPLSRSQIRVLAGADDTSASPRSAAVPAGATVSAARSVPAGSATTGPVLAPDIPQFFARPRNEFEGATLLYQPRLLGLAQVRYSDSRLKVDVQQDISVVTQITDAAVPVDWAVSEEFALSASELSKDPAPGEFAPTPVAAGQSRNYSAWAKDFSVWIQDARKLALLRSPALNEVSTPGEAERAFRIRLQLVAREARDAAAEKLRHKYAPRLTALQERLRRAEAAKQREAGQARRAKMDTVISFGSTLLGAFLGRKVVSAGTIGRAASTVRGVGRALDQSGDVDRAHETVEAVQQQVSDLQSQFEREVSALSSAVDPATEPLERVELRPSRSDIRVRLLALVWLPFVRDQTGVFRPGYV